jgi:cellulose synthase/poly-beta-1,6-N-acetylglucosamine synthase-like glycosyltransferase
VTTLNGLIGLAGLCYAGLMTWFMYGWLRLSYPSEREVPEPQVVFFSVIVPARDEAGVIHHLLNTLDQQHFSSKGFEVIVVNDHSTDTTLKEVQRAKEAYPALQLRVLQAPDPSGSDFVAYKKSAIQAGIRAARGSWIVTTDADCQPPPAWLSSLFRYIHDYQPYLVSGPVCYSSQKGLFARLQALEFMALISIGAASLRLNAPSMCNGANLAYKRSLFEAVGGFEGVDQIASGDDEFLMHKVHQHYPERVHFLKHQGAMVRTAPLSTLRAFVGQRKRWASKGAYYQSKWLRALTGFVGLYHLILVTAPLLPSGLPLYTTAMGFKLVPELLFLAVVSPFFSSSRKLLLYPPAALLYPFYVVGIGIYSQFGGYVWKDRKVR